MRVMLPESPGVPAAAAEVHLWHVWQGASCSLDKYKPCACQAWGQPIPNIRRGSRHARLANFQ